MKLLTYRRNTGSIGHGILSADGRSVQEIGDGDLSSVVAAGALPTLVDGPIHLLTEVSVLTPLLRPGKILCAATNYQEHIVEGGGTRVNKARTSPKLFNKFDTAVAGPGDVWLVPEISTAADWEVELAVIIGRDGRSIPVEKALDHVFGYATANDLSLRALDGMGFDRDAENPWVGFFDWLEGKWSDGSAPVGPYLVTADEVSDPQALPLSLSVNGTVRQKASTADMIFSCAELIAFASRLCSLRPGDMILTGTPAGVGATTGAFLVDGDEMVAEVHGLGQLVTPVRTGSRSAAE